MESPKTVPVYDISGSEPVLGDIPHDQVHDAISSGKFSLPQGQDINVISPEGEIGTIPSEKASDAFNNGFKYASPDQIEKHDIEEKYGSGSQQAIAGIEGLAKGVAGPLATYAETEFGVDPEAMRHRAEQNPITHGIGEAIGFGGSMLTGVGEGALIAGIGEAAAKSAGLGASTLSKIATSGIRTGAEMAAMQTGDEISKMITNEPGQSLGSAAINVGLSGILGGAGGAVIGSISPLWKAATEKSNLPKIIDEAKAQYNFRQTNPDVPSAITDELTTRMSEVDNIRSQLSELKGSSLARAMPEITEQNSSKINTQIQGISESIASEIESASKNAKLKGAVPYLSQDLNEFLEIVNNPQASYSEKFGAANDLKRTLDSYKNFNQDIQSTALAKVSEKLANSIRPALEDSKVWGEAANVQKKVNAAISASIKSEKDAASKFTSKLMGERVADQGKVTTLVNQLGKGKAGIKEDIINNYIKHTDELADTINKIHVDAGLEAPVSLTPTPALNHTVSNNTAGTKLGNWLYDKGLSSVTGSVAAEGIGAGVGSLVGHPIIGAYIGEKTLSPILSSIAKPLLEGATNSEAAKGAIDYIGSVIKGDKLLNEASKNIFKSAAQVIPEHMMPTPEKREKLEKSIDHNSDFNNATKIGGNIGHYLPNHASASGATGAAAINYLNGLKPKTIKLNPLDTDSVVDKQQQEKYNRALDVAQQPLVILNHVKKGTLIPQDIQTLNAIYPGMTQKIAQKVSENMINAIHEGQSIPYHQRVSLSLLTGTPLDSTNTQASMQSIMMCNGSPQSQPKQGPQRRPNSEAVKASQKSAAMYQTPLQAREANRNK